MSDLAQTIKWICGRQVVPELEAIERARAELAEDLERIEDWLDVSTDRDARKAQVIGAGDDLVSSLRRRIEKST